MSTVTKVYAWCKAGFGDTWQTASQSWTDVTAYLREFTVDWGRANEYDAFRAGTCTVVLDNRTRRFEPNYTGGAYYPNVKPWVPLKLGVTFTDGDSTTEACLFSGFVERWTLDYPGFGSDAVCRAQCSDGMKIPAQYQISLSVGSTTPGGMVDDVLDGVGWSTGSLWRTLDDGGVSSLSATTVEDEAALTTITRIAASDGGWFFSMPHSTAHTPALVFRDRLYPSENNTIQAAFGETTACVPYSDLEVSLDEERVRNRWKIGITASTKTAIANSTLSQDLYGLRVYAQTGLLLKTTGEADDRATHGIQSSAIPAVCGRVTALLRVGMDYARAVDLAVDAYGPLRYVEIIRGGLDESMIVDGCSVSYRVGEPCEFRYSLSPGSITGNYWILGDADWGDLGVTSWLGW